ncbi:MAG: Spo0E like sporulation regulatory protein [Paenibacillus sp.]|nr:Spo0E like sporulation regulatory protein [Paenibacillus sp.]
MIAYLQDKIESLRNQMIHLVFQHGSFTHEQVVTISQKLDRYIVMYQQLCCRTKMGGCI